MSRRLANRVSLWLNQCNAISDEDIELYTYAVQVCITTLFPLIMILCISAILGHIPEGIILILPFLTIRKYSGGYHAKTALRCGICSITLCVSFLLAAIYLSNGFAVQLLLVLACICLMLLSPVDSVNRNLSDAERRRFCHKARKITLSYVVIYLILTALHFHTYAVCIALGIVLAASLQLPCFFQQKRFKNKLS